MNLFEPVVIESLQLRNRIVFSPFIENMANRDGTVSPQQIEYYTTVARDGAGAVIVESAYVSNLGRAHFNQLGISQERHTDGLAQLVKAIKAEGALVGLRLAHAGAKTAELICGGQPVGPSILNFGKDYDTSREFDEGDVEEITLFFVHAAERAEEVGADFIEINGAQQYLLDQCISARHNNRADAYGGSMVERMRLSVEIVKAIKERIAPRIPIAFLFSVHDKVEDGFNAEDLKGLLRALTTAKVELLHPFNIHVMNKFFDTEETLVEWVHKFSRKPVVLEGNVKSPQILKEAMALNKAQLYALDRALFTRLNWYQFLQKKLMPQ
ncbi:MAG: NADH:flavin oxidoreductase [Candidatus Lambdaproteobacteria bacterium]|nr:NADH:flavin oxidoreductase [Candidatus Lambdaproteobacteria bacterium]